MDLSGIFDWSSSENRTIFVLNCRANEFNKSLLISSRVRTTLIVYFQLIMKILQKLILMSQPSKPNTVDSWENSSECAQFLVGFGSAQAKPQRTILFCWDRVAFVGQRSEGGNIWIQKTPLKETSIKTCKALCVFYQLALFKVTLLQKW